MATPGKTPGCAARMDDEATGVAVVRRHGKWVVLKQGKPHSTHDDYSSAAKAKENAINSRYEDSNLHPKDSEDKTSDYKK